MDERRTWATIKSKTGRCDSKTHSEHGWSYATTNEIAFRSRRRIIKKWCTKCTFFLPWEHVRNYYPARPQQAQPVLMAFCSSDTLLWKEFWLSDWLSFSELRSRTSGKCVCVSPRCSGFDAAKFYCFAVAKVTSWGHHTTPKSSRHTKDKCRPFTVSICL